MTDDRTEEIGEAIDDVMRRVCTTDGPGAGVAVVRNGHVLHAKGYGLANIEWNQPISPTTLFAIGSLTKQFTAVAVCMLHQEGKVDFDAQLNDVLTDYTGANGHATLRQLLHHTSGIRSYTSHPTPPDFRKDVELSELLTLIQSLPADFEPGEQYRYGNSGYVLLGAVIERLTGTRYHQFIRSRIFEPLQMSDSCMLFDGPIRARRAAHYWYDEKRGARNWPFVSMTWPHAAGALGSTLEDLVKWDRGLRSHTLLPASTSEVMHRATRLNSGEEYPYGFGFGLGNYLGHRCTHHAGGVAGFVSQIRSLYDPDLTIILLANYHTAPFDRITRNLARLALGLADVIREPVSLNRNSLDALAGGYGARDGQTIRVSREGANLAVAWVQGQSRRLIPFDESAFFEADDPEVEWRFDRGQLQHSAPSWPSNVYTRLADSD